jgi:hypothetical protein
MSSNALEPGFIQAPPLRDVSPRPSEETVQISGGDVENDDCPVIHPNSPTIVEESLDVEMKSFSLNLETGDVKTLIKIAEENPKKVFPIIDRAINEHGHIALGYIQENLRKAFIDIKLSKLKEYEDISISKGDVYIFRKPDSEMVAQFLGGGNLWWVEIIEGFSEFQNELMIINQNHLKDVIAEKVENSAIHVKFRDVIREYRFSDEVSYAIQRDNLPFIFEAKRPAEIEKITSEMLGKKWEDTLVYYYFLGGSIKWSDIDVGTFEAKTSLKKLAVARKDEDLLQRLEEV